MLGSWKVILQGDFSGIPFTAFWRHRCEATPVSVNRLALTLSIAQYKC